MLLLYADDTCLIYTGKDTKKIEEQLNRAFHSLCEWFIDNKLSIYFGEEKTKSILFGTNGHLKIQTDLNPSGTKGGGSKTTPPLGFSSVVFARGMILKRNFG